MKCHKNYLYCSQLIIQLIHKRFLKSISLGYNYNHDVNLKCFKIYLLLSIHNFFLQIKIIIFKYPKFLNLKYLLYKSLKFKNINLLI